MNNKNTPPIGQKSHDASIVQTSMDGFLALSLEGRLLRVNDAYCRMSGYGEEELLAKTIFDLEAKETAEETKEHIRKVVEKGGDRFESLHRRKNGETCEVEINAHYRADHPEPIILFLRDISTRKQIEKALRESEERFRSITELMSEVIFVMDDKGTIEYVSPASLRLYGYLPAEMIGRPFLEFVHPSGLSAAIEGFRAGMELGRDPVGLEILQMRKDGSTFIGEVNGTRFIAHLRPGAQVTIRDVTERRRVQDELLASNIRYRSLFDKAIDGIVIMDLTGRLVDVNASFARMHGYSVDELTGKRIQDLDHTETARFSSERLDRLKSGEVLNMEVQHYHRDGHTLSFDVVANRIEIDGKKLILAFHRDISQQKRIEQEKGELERQLVRAQRFEAIGTLSSGIAHDFNNILNIIIGNLDLLQEGGLDREQFSRRIDGIQKAADRGAQLVKQLLTLGRKSDIRLRPVEINDLISETVRLLFDTIPKGIRIQTDLELRLPPASADPNQIHQVLLNISLNARDAMPSGGQLTIASRLLHGEALQGKFPGAEGRSFIEIRLRDTGEGMDETTRKQIFDPFFTTKEVGKGTGLGLPVAFGIIERHQGFIDVSSEPGKGSEFTIYIPVAESPSAPAADLDSAMHTGARGTETILLIEDEEEIAATAKTALGKLGYAVHCVADGLAGVDYFKTAGDKIDIVLSDRGLPGLSGDEVFRSIRRINPRVPFILLTGFIPSGLKAGLLSEGITAVMDKPYRMPELLMAMREALDRRKP